MNFLRNTIKAFRIAIKNIKAVRYFPKASIVVFIHDAHKHGAQLLSLQLLKDFGSIVGKNRVVGVLLDKGPLVEEFQDLNTVYIPKSFSFLFIAIAKLLPLDTTLVFNSLVTQKVSEHFITPKRFSIALIHELPSLIKNYNLENLTKIVNICHLIIFPSTYVKNAFCSNYQVADTSKIRIIPQGLYQNAPKSSKAVPTVKKELALNDDSFLVCNLAYGDLRKAPDIFIATAISYARMYPDDDVHFSWIGGVDQSLKVWLDHDISHSNTSSKIHFLDFRQDAENVYSSLNCFFLSSREDPYPSAVIEAYHSDKPIILFDQGNGFTEIQSDQFIFVDYQNIVKVVSKIKRLYDTRPLFKHSSNLFYSSSVYAKKLIEITNP